MGAVARPFEFKRGREDLGTWEERMITWEGNEVENLRREGSSDVDPY